MSLKFNINESFKSTPKTCDGIEFNDDCISVYVYVTFSMVLDNVRILTELQARILRKFLNLENST